MKSICFILFSVNVLICSTTNAQIDDIKNQAYAAKVAKSPAKEFIIESDNNIVKANNYRDKIKGFGDAKLQLYLETYSLVIGSKNQILAKDPKWKMTKIDDFVADHETFYKQCQQKQADFLKLEAKFLELQEFFKNKEEMFVKSYRSTEQNSFFNFVSGTSENDFQWELIQSKIEEGKSTQAAYQKALANRDLDGRVKMNGLEYFTSDFRLKIEPIDFVKENGDVFKYADMEKLSVYLQSKKMLDEAKAFYYLYPETEGLKAVKEKYESTFNTLDAKYSKLAASPFHKEHMGEFFLSNHLVKIGSETINDFQTTFKAGEPVYVTYYGTVNYEKDDSRQFSLEKNGEKLVTDSPVILGPSENAKTVFQFALIPDESEKSLSVVNKISMFEFVKALQKLGTGEQNLSLRLGEYSSDPSINFTIDLTGQEEKLAAFRKEIETLNFNYIRMPKPGMSDPALTEIVRQGFKAEGEKHNVINTIILTDRWVINRHRITNEELSRELMEVAIICQDEKGCYMLIAHVGRAKLDSGGYEPAGIALKSTYRMTGNIWFKADVDGKIYFNCANK